MGNMIKTINSNKNTVAWILNFAILITIVFHPRIQDPFNSPKFWVLLLSASWLSGALIMEKINLSANDKKVYKGLCIIVVLYLIFLIMSSLFSYNKNTSFFGESFRRNGTLTYIAFAVFFMSAARFVRFENLKLYLNKILLVGTITSTYAFIQLLGIDFVDWTSQNLIITTLGNTNFAGASMAIFFILSFGQIFISSFSSFKRILAFCVSAILFLAILPTNARQALMILFFGIFLILLFKAYEFNKKISYILGVVGFSASIVAVLGTLQIGPLSDLLYKQSISVRGFYWRAGIEIFKDHPLFGVGIDNYGAFFKQYREAQYPLNYGFSITSSAAHNVFIQNFATGGLFVGTLYLLLQLLVFYKGLTLIKNFKDEKRFITVIIFVGWLSFQAQSFVSIDNIGISIWGWILGGTIIGLSFSESEQYEPKNQTKKSIEVDWKKLSISICATVLTLALVLPLYSGEKNTWLARSYFNPSSNDPKLQELFIKYSNNALGTRFISSDYKNITLTNLYSFEPQKAVDELKQITNEDFRNLDTLGLLAAANEMSGNLTESIKYRNEIAKYDPWNAPNYLSLGLMYKKQGDQQKMNLMLSKILSFASNDPIAKEAKEQLILTSE
jgi:O-antigen ligase